MSRATPYTPRAGRGGRGGGGGEETVVGQCQKRHCPFQPSDGWETVVPSEGTHTYINHTSSEEVSTPQPSLTPNTHPESDITIPGWVQTTTRPQQMRHDSEVPFPLISPPEAAMAGRLRFFLKNWQSLTTDRSVLETVSGFHLPFSQTPRQSSRPITRMTQEETCFIREEIQSLLQIGAIMEQQHPPQGSFFSTVPKKGGGRRPPPSLQDGGNPDSERYHGTSCSSWI